MAKNRATAEKAMEAWAELAFFNGRTDAAVNDLLETVCKEAGTPYYTIEDDPIWYSIRNLTNAWRRLFIKECAKIRATITDKEQIRHNAICA